MVRIKGVSICNIFGTGCAPSANALANAVTAHCLFLREASPACPNPIPTRTDYTVYKLGNHCLITC